MYMCVTGIDFATFYDFSIGSGSIPDSVVFLCFSFFDKYVNRKCIHNMLSLISSQEKSKKSLKIRKG